MPDNLIQRSILLMLFSTLCLSIANSTVRPVAADIHPFQIGFLVNLIIFLFIWPMALRPADPVFRLERRRLYTLCAIVNSVTTLAWFYALAHAPLAEATAVTFAAPILVTAFGALVWKEQVSPGRWLAVAAGFAGVMVIVRPGFQSLDHGTAALLIATCGMAAMYVLSKNLTKVDSTQRVAAIMTLIPILVGALPAFLVWRTPQMATMLWLCLMALAFISGRVAMLAALRHAPASTVMPLDFARLPFIALIAWLAFSETPDAWTLVGAALIVGAAMSVVAAERGAAHRTETLADAMPDPARHERDALIVCNNAPSRAK